jgi:hypothetical protein
MYGSPTTVGSAATMPPTRKAVTFALLPDGELLVEDDGDLGVE